MCTGFEILGAISAAMTIAGALSSKPSAPDVVRTDPAADEAAAKTKAAQDAQFATLESRKRARQNSLLSQAGAAGDMSTANTSGATAKASLGE